MICRSSITTDLDTKSKTYRSVLGLELVVVGGAAVLSLAEPADATDATYTGLLFFLPIYGE